jgi:hypothetical protein
LTSIDEKVTAIGPEEQKKTMGIYQRQQRGAYMSPVGGQHEAEAKRKSEGIRVNREEEIVRPGEDSEGRRRGHSWSPRRVHRRSSRKNETTKDARKHIRTERLDEGVVHA